MPQTLFYVALKKKKPNPNYLTREQLNKETTTLSLDEFKASMSESIASKSLRLRKIATDAIENPLALIREKFFPTQSWLIWPNSFLFSSIAVKTSDFPSAPRPSLSLRKLQHRAESNGSAICQPVDRHDVVADGEDVERVGFGYFSFKWDQRKFRVLS